MFKKITSLLLAVCMILCCAQFSVFALDEDREIENAKKAIRAAEKLDSIPGVFNDVSADEFLRAMTKLLPEGSQVKLSFVNAADFRIYNATSQKAGSIFANIQFECGVYKRRDMYTIKIPMLTGDAAIQNQDIEKLAADRKLVAAAFSNMSLPNENTKEFILKNAQGAVKNGSKVELLDDYKRVDSTATKKGSVKVTLKLTLNNDSTTYKVSNTLKLLEENTNTNTNTNTSTPNFTDVASDAYYANAVAWAVEKKITSGTSDTTFTPDANCTRAQILTFLWRAVGSPKATMGNPFTDVKTTDYYYDAAIWAYDMDMVEEGKFEANTPCTRAATVTYLWKNAGWPDASSESSFKDVSNNADYAEAVAWAVENKITSGISATEFGPDNICSRGQIVTFLNRALK